MGAGGLRRDAGWGGHSKNAASPAPLPPPPGLGAFWCAAQGCWHPCGGGRQSHRHPPLTAMPGGATARRSWGATGHVCPHPDPHPPLHPRALVRSPGCGRGAQVPGRKRRGGARGNEAAAATEASPAPARARGRGGDGAPVWVSPEPQWCQRVTPLQPPHHRALAEMGAGVGTHWVGEHLRGRGAPQGHSHPQDGDPGDAGTRRWGAAGVATAPMAMGTPLAGRATPWQWAPRGAPGRVPGKWMPWVRGAKWRHPGGGRTTEGCPKVGAWVGAPN